MYCIVSLIGGDGDGDGDATFYPGETDFVRSQ